MPSSILLAELAIAVALPMLGWSLLSPRLFRDKAAETNLARGFAASASAEQRREPPFSAIAKRFTPAGVVARLDRLLVRAGRPAAWPMKRVLSAKVLLGGMALALGFLFVLAKPGAFQVLLSLLFTVLCYFLPDVLLYGRGAERQTAIGLALADTLDQMTIAVEAGLGFEAAMARAAHNGKGPLAEELVRTLQDMQVGRSRREAYLDLAARTTVTDLRRFVRSIIQADAYGISISGVLRTQASEMRLKRRQRAEEKAMQIPVKVLFPLMFCILPVLFIVLLGPAAIGVVNTFSK